MCNTWEQKKRFKWVFGEIKQVAERRDWTSHAVFRLSLLTDLLLDQTTLAPLSHFQWSPFLGPYPQEPSCPKILPHQLSQTPRNSTYPQYLIKFSHHPPFPRCVWLPWPAFSKNPYICSTRIPLILLLPHGMFHPLTLTLLLHYKPHLFMLYFEPSPVLTWV